MKKMSLSGLIGYLQGIGLKIKANEKAESEDEVFEIDDPEGVEESQSRLTENASSGEFDVSEEELVALKNFARTLVQNGDDSQYDVSGEELDALKSFAQLMVKNKAVFSSENLLAAVKTAPAAAVMVKNAQASQQRERESLIATIKTNAANIYSDEDLNSMPLPILVKMNAQMNVSYAGAGGAQAVYENSSQPLRVRPVLLGTQREEA